LHIGIFFSVPYWEFYIAKFATYIAKPEMYIPKPAIYIPKPAIENLTEEKRKCNEGL
jgi:hypothetical protein